jgi:hypothetical protein
MSAVDYTIYIGVDDNDAFFMSHITELEAIGRVVILTGCNHAPAWAWNRLAEVAHAADEEYLFQIGDDVVLESVGWTERFVEILLRHKNRGVVGPLNPVNAAARGGQNLVIENAFVHRSHVDVFGSFFHPTIRNWHCDEWMTRVYEGICSQTCTDIIVHNGCIDKRYAIESVNIQDRVQEGRRTLRRALRGCFSFCLYGPYTDKYYKGFIENVPLIREHYPNCDIQVYASPEAVPFIRANCPDVILCETSEIGSRNKSYRFIPAFADTYEFVCVRDTDSRIHARDRWCIDTFLDSLYDAYTIRDHQWHGYKIMCGLWGCKGRIDVSYDDLKNFVNSRPEGYAVDAELLNTYVYPRIHDRFVVFSHVSNGVLGDPSEKVHVIEHPLENQEFCGNVVLYRDGVPYHEFDQV